MRQSLSLATLMMMLATPAIALDVKVEERTRVQLPGALGSVARMFGGDTAREGTVSKTFIKGDRRMSLEERSGTIVDLAEERIYELDLNRKTYTIVSFADMRRRMEEARQKATRDMGRPRESAEMPPEFEMDFKIEETGQKKTINGHDTRELLVTISVRPKDPNAPKDPTGAPAAMTVTSSQWLAAPIPAMRELADFQLRYMQKLGILTGINMEQMAAAMAMFPGMKEAMERLQAEGVKLEGTPIQTITRMGTGGTPTAPAPTPEAAPPSRERPRGLGGLIGGLGGRLGRRSENPDNANANAAPPGSGAAMTIDHEVLSIGTSVSADEVAIPAGFKERK